MGLERRFQDAWGDAPTMMCVGKLALLYLSRPGPIWPL